MGVFLLILLQVIFPVFALLGLGALLHRRLRFDPRTLSRLTGSVLLPALVFANLYEARFEAALVLQVALFLLLQNGLLMLAAEAAARWLRLEARTASTFRNSIVLFNSGNFGLPVSQLVFATQPVGMSIQVIVTLFQTLVTNTYGLFNAMRVETPGWRALRGLALNPIVLAMLAGIALQATGLRLPDFIWRPIDTVASAFLAVALFTLGAQIAGLRLRRPSLPLLLTAAGRLLISPALALALILALGLDGVTAQALLIAGSFPCSRNMAQFAMEHGNDPDYAAEAVLLTTLLSSLTVAATVFAAQQLFG
ncbi:AEC family transporter [Paenibacillus pasadenensis]|uniref:Putative membrane protein n=1 Tax=Paenibacillus pasadenensis TaxID=217090 RepID=A0A2N5NCR0_9BACL|nr:AEC family transporter [Paenibacillus pasadenensis]PLT48127.1 putative membrane protein [Paenibacillus pasadenensis]